MPDIQAFAEVVRALPEPCALVSGTGEVRAASRAAHALLGTCVDRLPTPLSGLVATPADRVTAYLRACSGSRAMVPGALELGGGADAEPQEVRCEGAVVRPWTPEAPALVLLRFRSKESAVQRFLALNRQIEELTLEIHERKRMEARLRVLVEAGSILATSLDYRSTLRSVARLVVPALAEWCIIDLVENGGVERVEVTHADPAMARLARQLRRFRPDPGDDDRPVARVLRTGEPEFVAEVTPEYLRAHTRDARHREVIEELGARSLMVVPMTARAQTIGAVTLLAARRGRRYGPGDLELAREIAGRAAAAIDNARLYREAQQARAAAEHANRAKSQFLTVMSHELRTPLNAIMGYQDLLAGGVLGPVTGRQEHALGRIHSSTRHLLGLIDQVLSLSRIEAGKEQLRLERVDLPALARDTAALVEPLARVKGLRLVVRAAGAATMEVDAAKLRQVLLNLLGNAVKFTERGEIELRIAAGDDAVACTVRDTGPGIAPENLERIFDLFEQVHSGPTREQGGTGLGLPVSRHLARILGGELTVESEPGRGSSFTLRLPRGAAAPQRAV